MLNIRQPGSFRSDPRASARISSRNRSRYSAFTRIFTTNALKFMGLVLESKRGACVTGKSIADGLEQHRFDYTLSATVLASWKSSRQRRLCGCVRLEPGREPSGHAVSRAATYD